MTLKEGKKATTSQEKEHKKKREDYAQGPKSA